MAEPGFDPAAEVVLGDGSRVPPPADFRARCTIRERRADRLVVDMDSNAGGHLVVAEAYQDGWKATLDGSEVPVRPANVLFRAVAVPAGSHRVELRYRPAAVYWGAALTATGLDRLAVPHPPPAAQQRDGLPEGAPDVHRPAGRQGGPRLVEQVVQRLRQPLRLPGDDGEQPLLLLRHVGLPHQHLGRSADGAE